MTTAKKSMDDIMALCKRRGFVYQASEIYGGINGFWDYGPLGAQLKKNLRDAWWEDMVMNPCRGRRGPGGERVRCVPVETCIVQHPRVWEASGHVAGFNDPMVDCRKCKSRFRADHVWVVGYGDAADLQEAVKRFPDLSLNELAAAIESGDPQQIQHGIRRINDLLRLHDSVYEGAFRVRYFKSFTAGSFEEFAPKMDVLLTLSKREAKAFQKPVLCWQGSLDQFLKEFGSNAPCPQCGAAGTLTEPRQFNLMFRTYIGATATEDDVAYLRPETAQGIFVQFKNVVDTTRVRVPFGIGNTGRSFRNEVTPRNFTFRSREFEQAELEFFCHPDEAGAWYAFWRDFRMDWWRSVGLGGDNLRLREHEKDELSHYSTATCDIEYRFPFTAPDFGELEGVAHRGCYDLTQHTEHSGVKLDYFDTDRGETLPNGSTKGERYVPHVIEPAAGLDRGALAIVCEAYTRDESRPSPEIMRFHPRIAPIKAAVFPLVNKDGMPEVAERLHAELFARFGRAGFVEMDAKQSIGKRYARMDEAGCPCCFTVDGDTLKDQTVTVRDRDTGAQERIGIDRAGAYLAERLGT